MELAYYKAWGYRFDQGMVLRRRVMDLLGITLPRQIGRDTREVIRQSMIGCTTCDRVRSCLSWLEVGDASDGPPDFCPNRSTFLELMKEAT